MQPPTLSGFQRRWLRGKAHPLRPIVQVGSGGLSDSVARALDEVLVDHELVKVRLHAPEDKRAMASALARSSNAALCGVVGHTVILYRPHPKTPALVLPTRDDED